MKNRKKLADVAITALFAVTNPIVIPMRKLGMFNPKQLGATAIEYGLVAAGIAVAIIAVVNSLGTSISIKPSSPPTIQSAPK